MNAACLEVMASIGVIATIMTFVAIAVYFVDKFQTDDNGTGVKDMPRALGVAKPGDVVILEVPGAVSVEAHQRYMQALDAMNTGVKFVLLSDGVRLARVGSDEP
jgi:hypothetical protein